MPTFDLPLAELERYRPSPPAAPEFDPFWAETLAQADRVPLDPRFDPVSSPFRTLEVIDVTFNGYGGDPVRAWLMLPDSPGPWPCFVKFVGYGGGRGLPMDHLFWPSVGYALLVMDTRGQGAGWSVGDTPDPDASAPHVPGFMTRGIADRHGYYYRRVFVDAVRAVAVARLHPRIDAGNVVVGGVSQGGGISLAVSGLVPDIQAALIDVPFLCHFERATQIATTPPYTEIVNFLKLRRDRRDDAFATLAYFDGLNFAPRASAPALFSVALMDETCPPSTVFAAYNLYGGPKQLRVWPFNTHEGGDQLQVLEQLDFLAALRP